MTDTRYREGMKFFLLGLLVTAGIFSLMGFKSNDDIVIDSGRYQLSAWGDGKAHGAFVMDTLTGQTKIVYRHNELGGVRYKEKNNLNRPFIKIE